MDAPFSAVDAGGPLLSSLQPSYMAGWCFSITSKPVQDKITPSETDAPHKGHRCTKGCVQVRSLRDLIANALQDFLLQPGHLYLGNPQPARHFRLSLVAIVPEVHDQTLPVGQAVDRFV